MILNALASLDEYSGSGGFAQKNGLILQICGKAGLAL
jgi:hypothetical protein